MTSVIRLPLLLHIMFVSICYIASPSAFSLEPVKLQLRWHHQFQFAGYYAAQHKGFYKEAGFDVTIIAGSPQKQPVAELLNGNVDFAEGNSEVLINRLKGEPLVALAAIFQHSPSVLVTLKDSQIKFPSELIDKSVMLVKGGADSDLITMLESAGIDSEKVRILDSSYNIQDLIDGKVDAFNSYLTNEPFYLQEQGYEYNIINPRDYGVDFYSDILFTTTENVESNPDRVERFRQASIKGWEYAITHPDEIIELLRQQYQVKKSLKHLQFEAQEVIKLVNTNIVPIGHMHEKRFEHMFEIFAKQGIVSPIGSGWYLKGFMFKPPAKLSYTAKLTIIISIAVALTAIGIAAFFINLSQQLQNQIKLRHAAERQLIEVANTDPLTGIYNRRAFVEKIEEEIKNSIRFDNALSVILFDLDLFKSINDTYGHQIGDQVLCSITECVNDSIQKSDLLARYGGEEFIILLPCTHEDKAYKVAERLRKLIEELTIIIEHELASSVAITASFGVAEWHESLEENILNLADRALYRAKEKGRNRVEKYSDFK